MEFIEHIFGNSFGMLLQDSQFRFRNLNKLKLRKWFASSFESSSPLLYSMNYPKKLGLICINRGVQRENLVF